MSRLNATHRASSEKEILFKTLVETALTKKQSKFELLRSLSECWVLLVAKQGLKKIVVLFEDLAYKVYEKYCVEVKRGTASFNTLYIATQYRYCGEFYKKEFDIAKEMLKEYWAYLKAGHFVEQVLLGRTRVETDMYDFRGNKNGTD